MYTILADDNPLFCSNRRAKNAQRISRKAGKLSTTKMCEAIADQLTPVGHCRYAQLLLIP